MSIANLSTNNFISFPFSLLTISLRVRLCSLSSHGCFEYVSSVNTAMNQRWNFTKHAVGKGAKRSGAPPASSQILVTKIGIQSGVRELAGARCACPLPDSFFGRTLQKTFDLLQ